jgi:hypothetical protein
MGTGRLVRTIDIKYSIPDLKVYYHEIVCKLRPLGLNNTPLISFKLVKSLFKCSKYDISNRRPLDVKWRELDFTLLLNSTLKSLTLG